MYESPIEIIYSQIRTQLEDDVLKAVQRYGINVNKEELIKALRYDRQQYKKGYEDAKAEQKWVSCSERMPDEGRECWITAKTTEEVYRGTFTEFYGVRHDVGFICDNGDFMWWNTAKAWMYCEKPETYKGEKDE